MKGFDVRPGETPPAYLTHPAFTEPNAGPRKRGAFGVLLKTRHPSPDQIARRGAVIRAYYARVLRRRNIGPRTTP